MNLTVLCVVDTYLLAASLRHPKGHGLRPPSIIAFMTRPGLRTGSFMTKFTATIHIRTVAAHPTHHIPHLYFPGRRLQVRGDYCSVARVDKPLHRERKVAVHRGTCAAAAGASLQAHGALTKEIAAERTCHD